MEDRGDVPIENFTTPFVINKNTDKGNLFMIWTHPRSPRCVMFFSFLRNFSSLFCHLSSVCFTSVVCLTDFYTQDNQ